LSPCFRRASDPANARTPTNSDHLGKRSVQPVPESETLMDLLVQWEELRPQGNTATPGIKKDKSRVEE